MKMTARVSDKAHERVFAESQFRDNGFVMPEYHYHPYYELFYVERGACRFMIDDNMYDLHIGDFMLIPPQVVHYTRYVLGTCKRDAIFFQKEDIDEPVRKLLPQGDVFFTDMRIFQVPMAYRTKVTEIITQMVNETKFNDMYSRALLEVMLQELFLMCARVCSFFHDVPAKIHTTDKQIVAAARYISEHYMDQITTEEIADNVGFSANYLSRKFREVAGIGVHQYLVYTRLRHGALELASTEDSVTEIAFRCGFTDSNYFGEAFRRAYGVAPREYRRIRTYADRQPAV